MALAGAAAFEEEDADEDGADDREQPATSAAASSTATAHVREQRAGNSMSVKIPATGSQGNFRR